MGESRQMFDFLLGNLDDYSLEALRTPLEEIASGNSSFGPLEEWTTWSHYLLAQLLPRHAEQSFDSMYQNLVTAFIAVHPRQIDEPYAGFARDARQALGQCLMDPIHWKEGQLAVSPQGTRSGNNNRVGFEWSVACGDFSASMFFCAKYLDDDQIDGWLASAFSIRCPLWTTQLYVWLLEAYPLLSGHVLSLADLDADRSTNVVWLGALVLRGDFSGRYDPEPPPLPLLPEERREALLAGVHKHISRASYLEWLDAIKQYPGLEDTLHGVPARFAEIFSAS